MFRKAAAILLIVGLLAGTGYAAYRWNNPDDVPPAFERDQFIEVQIVSVPIRHVAGERDYTQDELRNVGYTDYSEKDVTVHSKRILRVFNTGRSQEFQATVEGIEMVGGWGSAHARADGQPGLRLDDFQFSFPSTSWATSSSARLMGLWFSPTRTTLGREFATVTMIAYQGDADPKTEDDSPDTFLRVRWLPEPPEETIVKLYESDSAADKSAAGR